MDVAVVENLDPHEEVLHKHRKEKKELQAQIQALKKSVTKGDKKKKKEVSEEISKLEKDLEKRHAEEIAAVTVPTEATDVSSGVNNLSLSESVNGGEGSPLGKHFRVTKAQKRRDKKAAMLKERELRIIEQETQNLSSARTVETDKIKELLKKRGLMIHEVPSDGNCLYCAVADQLTDPPMTVAQLRLLTTQVLSENSTEYLPFLSHPDTGEMLTEKQFEDYCDQVANTAAWGGQVELRAMCQALHKCIEVVQSEGPSIIVGSEFAGSSNPIVITYHRHMYGLGEHYNSVRPYQEEPEEQPFV